MTERLSLFNGSAEETVITRKLTKISTWLRRYQLKTLVNDREYVEVRQLLGAMVEAGLLISERHLVTGCGENGDDSHGAEINTLAIATRNRPVALKECVSSYFENAKRFERRPELIVADDSDDKECQKQVQSVLSYLSRDYGIRTTHLDFEAKNELANHLRVSGIPASVVKYGLFGTDNSGERYGANRNALLLHSNTLMLMVDDDTICKASAHPEPTSGLKVTDEDIYDLWVFRSRDETLGFSQPLDIDVLGAHEQLLGKRLGRAVADFVSTSKVELGLICHHILESLQKGNGRIVVTTNGAFGDCGLYSPTLFLGLEQGPTRNRVLTSKHTYKRALESGELLRVARLATICHKPELIGTFLGIDNRGCLPPFMPVGRSEDAVFAATLAKCFPSSYFGHLPWALFHVGSEVRTYVCGYLESVEYNRICDVLRCCIQAFDPPSDVTESVDKLTALGQFLIQLGSKACGEFDQFVRERLQLDVDMTVSHLQSILSSNDSRPKFWADYVERWITARQHAVVQSHFTVAREFLSGRSLQEAQVATQEQVSQFGALLQYWREMVAVASRLRLSGISRVPNVVELS
jgi:hypothetical protein